MSAKASFWAWEQILKSSQKFVLLCLADNHNADNGRCDPSATYVSKKTGLNVKTVYSALQELEKLGILAIKKRAGTSAQYDLNLTQKRVHPKAAIPENGSTQIYHEPDPKTGRGVYPKTGNKPNNKPKKNLIHEGNEFPDFIDRELFDDFLSMRKRMKKPMTEKAIQRQVNKLIDFHNNGISANEALITATDKCWLDTYPPDNKTRQVSILKSDDTTWIDGPLQNPFIDPIEVTR